MADPSRTVFLSYRRDVSWAMARLVSQDLSEHGFDTFMDVQSIDSGEFERVILAQIEARTHFLVLLEPGSLEKIGEAGDWLRRDRRRGGPQEAPGPEGEDEERCTALDGRPGRYFLHCGGR